MAYEFSELDRKILADVIYNIDVTINNLFIDVSIENMIPKNTLEHIYSIPEGGGKRELLLFLHKIILVNPEYSNTIKKLIEWVDLNDREN